MSRFVRVGLCIRNAKSAQYHKDRANVEYVYVYIMVRSNKRIKFTVTISSSL